MSTRVELEGSQLQLEIFRRRCMQMIDPEEINFPDKWFIKLPTTQAWIYENMFNKDAISFLSYPPYAFRILKKLVVILEAAIEDPEEDVSTFRDFRALFPTRHTIPLHSQGLTTDVSFAQEISDDLANCFAKMLREKTKDETDSIQEKRPVTYTAPFLDSEAAKVTILEAPNLLSSNGDTGNRTWDAALFLATYLSTDGRCFVQDKSVLELGAGLGFVSILCGKHLGAKHVLTTDASGAVLDVAQQNARLNGVEDIVKTAVLQWGTPDIDYVLESGWESVSYDLVIGSDMLYEPRDFPALMSTLQDLFTRFPQAQVLMSSAIRNETTSDSFLDACNLQLKHDEEKSFYVERVQVNPVPEKEQLGFFHSTFVDEIRIYLITRSRRLMTSGREFLDTMSFGKIFPEVQ
ncbi:MAG: hypothetical protein Q9166_000901 [cf. Caloplaca sp. 2 TL-2023]